MKKLWNFVFHTEVGLYLFYGVVSMVFSLIAYYAYMLLFDNYYLATIVKNIVGIAMAYFANHSFVFKSSATGIKRAKEIITFLLSRAFTFGIDLILMWVMVDLVNIHSYIAGVLSTLIVILLNYILSKAVVFKKQPIS